MQTRRWPVHGWVGLGLVMVFWPLNWCLPGYPTTWGFFPLWLGYCLAVDALVFWRRGSSILTRSPAGFVSLFVVSAPAWWMFELFNERLGNWVYEGAEAFDTPLKYYALGSLSFSTVMPAVFGTAELAATLVWVRRLGRGPVFPFTWRPTLVLFLAGWVMLALWLAWPRWFFPLVWLSVFFILDPLNAWLGQRSLLEHAARGDWRPLVALSLGCLVCGFFWELWNFHSYPRWRYEVPFVSFFKVFEMPVLGYGGYIPFAWELFALYHLVSGLAGCRGAAGVVRLAPARR